MLGGLRTTAVEAKVCVGLAMCSCLFLLGTRSHICDHTFVRQPSRVKENFLYLKND